MGPQGTSKRKGKDMENESELFPVDFNVLAKGQVIAREKVKEIYKTVTEQEHAFACMELCKDIECRRPDLYPVIRKGGVVLLTDEEAHQHNVNRHAKLIGDMSRNAKRRARIDHEQLSESQRREAEHWDVAMAAHALAARRSLRASKREALMLGGKQEEP